MKVAPLSPSERLLALWLVGLISACATAPPAWTASESPSVNPQGRVRFVATAEGDRPVFLVAAKARAQTLATRFVAELLSGVDSGGCTGSGLFFPAGMRTTHDPEADELERQGQLILNALRARLDEQLPQHVEVTRTWVDTDQRRSYAEATLDLEWVLRAIAHAAAQANGRDGSQEEAILERLRGQGSALAAESTP